MKHLGFASISALNQYLRYAQARGLDCDALIAQAGLSATLLAQQNGRIKGEQFQALLIALEAQSQDPLMGLNSSVFVGPQSYNTLGLMAMNSQTLGQVIERIPTFERLVGDMGTTHIQQDQHQLSLTWHCNYPHPNIRPHMIDNVLASWTQFARWLAQSQARLSLVTLNRQQPKADVAKRYQQFFNCPIEFNANSNSITLSKELLELPIQRARAKQLQANSLADLDGLARTQLSSLALEDESFSEQIKRAIQAHLQLGAASKELIAQEFNITPRTIQRRLANEGESYQGLLDELRFERAKAFIEQGALSYEEIAYNLGFASERCFYRSFKRWSGMRPGEYKQQLYSA